MKEFKHSFTKLLPQPCLLNSMNECHKIIGSIAVKFDDRVSWVFYSQQGATNTFSKGKTNGFQLLIQSPT